MATPSNVHHLRVRKPKSAQWLSSPVVKGSQASWTQVAGCDNHCVRGCGAERLRADVAEGWRQTCRWQLGIEMPLKFGRETGVSVGLHLALRLTSFRKGKNTLTVCSGRQKTPPSINQQAPSITVGLPVAITSHKPAVGRPFEGNNQLPSIHIHRWLLTLVPRKSRQRRTE